MAADLGGSKNASDDELDHHRAGKRQRGVAAFRPTSIRFSLTEVSHAYLWRYRHCEFLPYDAGGRIWQVVHSAAANAKNNYEGTQTFVSGLHCMDVKLSDRSSNDLPTHGRVT
jgi:ribosomal protein L22